MCYAERPAAPAVHITLLHIIQVNITFKESIGSALRGDLLTNLPNLVLETVNFSLDHVNHC